MVDGTVDPITVNLIGNNGNDIIEFFNNSGYTMSEMGIFTGLTDWAAKEQEATTFKYEPTN